MAKKQQGCDFASDSPVTFPISQSQKKTFSNDKKDKGEIAYRSQYKNIHHFMTISIKYQRGIEGDGKIKNARFFWWNFEFFC